jgi:hypothetical protein
MARFPSKTPPTTLRVYAGMSMVAAAGHRPSIDDTKDIKAAHAIS